MAGTLISLIRKTDYTFIVRAGNPTDTVLVPLVDTTNLTSGVILWRIYSLTLNGTTLNMVLDNVMTGPDDPNTILVAATDVVSTSITTANTLYAASVPQPVGKYLRVAARVPAGTAGTAVVVTLAADLLMRDT